MDAGQIRVVNFLTHNDAPGQGRPVSEVIRLQWPFRGLQDFLQSHMALFRALSLWLSPSYINGSALVTGILEVKPLALHFCLTHTILKYCSTCLTPLTFAGQLDSIWETVRAQIEQVTLSKSSSPVRLVFDSLSVSLLVS